jgi:hypothetical protein
MKQLKRALRPEDKTNSLISGRKGSHKHVQSLTFACHELSIGPGFGDAYLAAARIACDATNVIIGFSLRMHLKRMELKFGRSFTPSKHFREESRRWIMTQQGTMYRAAMSVLAA